MAPAAHSLARQDTLQAILRRSPKPQRAHKHANTLNLAPHAPSPAAGRGDGGGDMTTGVASGGATCEDPPGWRDGAFGKMYLAYLRDPDGNKLGVWRGLAFG